MPFVPVPGTIEYVVTTVTGSDVFQNVFHSRPNDFPDLIPVIDRVASVRAAWGNRIMPQLANSCAMTTVSGKDLSTQEGDSVELGGAQVNGSLVGEIGPPQVTALIQKVTALGGRSRRGRLYLSGVRDVDVDGGMGVLVAGYRTALQNAFSSFLGDIQAIGGTSDEQMVVVSRYKGVDVDGKPIARPAGLVTPITALLVTQSIATQRDRNRRI
jgi:hypothetical protein